MRLATKQARLQINSRDDVLSVRVSGLVTVSTIDEIRLFLAPMAERAAAIWVDYTASVVAVTDLELQSLVSPIARGARSIPMAWAAPDTGTVELWGRQSLRLALHGHRRFVAGGIDAAARWAHQQALLAPVPAAR